MPPEPPSAQVWIQILGPLSLRVDGSDVSVPGTRRRALLAALARAQGRVGRHRSPRRHALAGRPARQRGSGAAQPRVADPRSAGSRRWTPARTGAPATCSSSATTSSTRRSSDGWRPSCPSSRRRPCSSEHPRRSRCGADRRSRSSADIPELYVEAVALDELKLRIHDELLRALIDVGDDRAVAEARSAVAADPLHETRRAAADACPRRGRSCGRGDDGGDDVPTSPRRRDRPRPGSGAGPARAGDRLGEASARAPGAGPGRLAAWLLDPSGPLVGRQQDYDEMLRLHAKHRLVTVTGPGGVGKTRLALEVAAALAERDQIDAVVVDLAAVEDAARVLQAVASTVGLRVVAAASPSPVDIAVALADAQPAAGPRQRRARGRGLPGAGRCRRPARAGGSRAGHVTTHAARPQRVRPAPPAAARRRASSTTCAALVRQPSVRAFLEHARRHDRHYELTAADAEPLVEILKHLDGLPLAIELVARQVAVLPLAAIRDRLGRALDLSSSPDGDEGRQRTLRVTIRWSYDRLSPTQQALLRAVSRLPRRGGPGHRRGAGRGGGRQCGIRCSCWSVWWTPRCWTSIARAAAIGSCSPSGASCSTRSRPCGELSETEERFLAWAVRAADEIGAGLFSAEEALADRRLRAELDNLRAARDLARARRAVRHARPDHPGARPGLDLA